MPRRPHDPAAAAARRKLRAPRRAAAAANPPAPTAKRAPTWRAVVRCGAVSAAVAAVCTSVVGLANVATERCGHSWRGAADLVFAWVGVSILLGLAGGAVTLVARRILVAVALLLYGATGWGVLRYWATASWQARMDCFADCARRAEPLVDALHAYSRATGAWPRSLADLVPGFLVEVPGTDMPAYPRFELRRRPSWLRAEGSEPRESWELVVPCSVAFGNDDEFVYWPDERYPDRMFGAPIVRIARWAYVRRS